ncbi:hypothetical protein SLS62_010604 [Diatrype stigma]|uniref:Calpastatin n=1 Tax=Diatrype stigma TaxID=117547 RepID=A0AAN9UBP3_9PEZI
MDSPSSDTCIRQGVDLDIFLRAQNSRWDTALDEIKNGRKESHWIWFIWPQLSRLGSSLMSRIWAIPSLEAAREYLSHEVLGARLHEITEAALNWDSQGQDIESLMGSETDKLKLQSCMTLFMRASDKEDTVFKKVLDKYYEGKPDAATDDRLAKLCGNTANDALPEELEDTA